VARRISRQSQNVGPMSTWWIRAVLGVVFVAICYGAASWAINTANMFAYGVTIFFAVWAIAQFKRSVQLIFSR
jgi:uncharacterized membrane protein YobD (UPF0266 family)